MKVFLLGWISLLIAISLAPVANAQLENGFHFTNPDYDKWVAKDKTDHLIGGIGTTFITTIAVKIIRTEDHITSKNIRNIAIFNAAMWLLWEVKDGAYSLEHYESPIGGDGFSYRDWLWSLAGIAIMTGISLLLNK